MKRSGYILALAMILRPPGYSQPAPSTADRGDIAVVVNPANPVSTISLPDLRRMLTGERRFWMGNVRVKLLLREPGTWERDRVLSRVLQIDNKAFAEQWRAKVFRGEASEGPSSIPAGATVEQYLRVNPGGIAFIEANAPSPRMKVLRLDGRLPGEPGYVLK